MQKPKKLNKSLKIIKRRREVGRAAIRRAVGYTAHDVLFYSHDAPFYSHDVLFYSHDILFYSHVVPRSLPLLVQGPGFRI